MPATQLKHADSDPAFPWYWPAAHATQLDADRKVPAEHTTAEQAIAPDTDVLPTAHATQLEDAEAPRLVE